MIPGVITRGSQPRPEFPKADSTSLLARAKTAALYSTPPVPQGQPGVVNQNGRRLQPSVLDKVLQRLTVLEREVRDLGAKKKKRVRKRAVPKAKISGSADEPRLPG
jgi:hypothetical protein